MLLTGGICSSTQDVNKCLTTCFVGRGTSHQKMGMYGIVSEYSSSAWSQAPACDHEVGLPHSACQRALQLSNVQLALYRQRFKEHNLAKNVL